MGWFRSVSDEEYVDRARWRVQRDWKRRVFFRVSGAVLLVATIALAVWSLAMIDDVLREGEEGALAYWAGLLWGLAIGVLWHSALTMFVNWSVKELRKQYRTEMLLVKYHDLLIENGIRIEEEGSTPQM